MHNDASNSAYNGWSNRATWNVNLWLSNDDRTYRDINRLALGVDATDEGDVDRLGVLIRSYCADLWPTGETPDGDALIDADFFEIAESWLAD